MEDGCIRCPQEKCGHNHIGIGEGCRPCEECGCAPNIIDTNCDRCLSCSRDEGVLRWSDGLLDVLLRDSQKENEIVVK